MKTVHVELADKGCIVVVFEEFGDHRPRKLIFVNDSERLAVFRPANQMHVTFVIEIATHISILYLNTVIIHVADELRVAELNKNKAYLFNF